MFTGIVQGVATVAQLQDLPGLRSFTLALPPGFSQDLAIGASVAVAGVWPERLRPAVFIFTAPPAVLGLAVLQLGAAPAWGWAFWGMALFSLLWAGTQLPAIRRQAFAVAHWALSFPLAAFTALTLRLAEPGGALVVPAVALLAASSLLVAALLLATVRGLRAGTLLAPETVAVIQSAAG